MFIPLTPSLSASVNHWYLHKRIGDVVMTSLITSDHIPHRHVLVVVYRVRCTLSGRFKFKLWWDRPNTVLVIQGASVDRVIVI